jgi:hypothetical protein
MKCALSGFNAENTTRPQISSPIGHWPNVVVDCLHCGVVGLSPCLDGRTGAPDPLPAPQSEEHIPDVLRARGGPVRRPVPVLGGVRPPLTFHNLQSAYASGHTYVVTAFCALALTYAAGTYYYLFSNFNQVAALCRAADGLAPSSY